MCLINSWEHQWFRFALLSSILSLSHSLPLVLCVSCVLSFCLAVVVQENNCKIDCFWSILYGDTKQPHTILHMSARSRATRCHFVEWWTYLVKFKHIERLHPCIYIYIYTYNMHFIVLCLVVALYTGVQIHTHTHTHIYSSRSLAWSRHEHTSVR